MECVIEMRALAYEPEFGEVPPGVDLSGATFAETVQAGRFVAWLIADDMSHEDYGFAPYEGDDVEVETVELLSVDAERRQVAVQLTFDVLLGEPADDMAEPIADVFSAVSSGLMVFWYAGHEESPHPEMSDGLCWFSGEMHRVVIDGTVLHDRVG